ncbi:MAG TPA: glycosyltransferase [Armatimonadota bacterium]|nr:glycosyltransferase [Armatimonadota bacterium]
MRVGFLSSWDERCGIADYSRSLVDALRRRAEVDVVPATFRRSPKELYRAMGKALSAGDVAHVQHSYTFFGGLHPLHSAWSALAGAIRRPLLVTVHELDLRATGATPLPSALEQAYKRRFNRSVFLHPAIGGWMVHAAVLRASLMELGAPPERVVYRPMPIPAAGPAPDPAPLRRRLGLEGKRPLVILGFLARRKGYDLALEALRRLPAEFVLVAAGGEHAADRSGTESWLREQAAARGLSERLRITGYLSEAELEQATALAEVVLAPFTEMSASASLNYALARGKAVVASDLPENRRLECLRLFPTGDAAALAEAVRELAGSPGLRAALSRAALDYAAGHSYDALAEETLALYRELLSRAALPR